MTAQERRLAILRDLYRLGRLKASMLASKYGVSRKTIMRDAIYISLNHPVITERGRNGGIGIIKSPYADAVRKKEESLAVLEKIIKQHEEGGRCELNETEVNLMREMLKNGIALSYISAIC